MENEIVVEYIYLSGPKKLVIERDTDILTGQEIQDHQKEVQAAMLTELEPAISSTVDGS